MAIKIYKNDEGEVKVEMGIDELTVYIIAAYKEAINTSIQSLQGITIDEDAIAGGIEQKLIDTMTEDME